MPASLSFRIGELVRLKHLKGVDALWNGEYAIVLSNPYFHSQVGYTVVNIAIANNKWAVEPYNLEKTYDEEYDAYIQEKYIEPKENICEFYDGMKPVQWSDCIWQPKDLKK